MPRPGLPPTPASSTDIKGREGNESTLQMSFELPPPALASMENSRPSSVSAQSSSASSYHPNSPLSPAMRTVETPSTRRKPAASKEKEKEKDNFTLPPPPTRSRKIIQMKPKEEEEHVATKTTSGKKGEVGTKKKQPSSTSVAGRKIARKTAHSLIERRRRSKMNEEFGVLKNMIPACTGEMHKLAILQASIDYVRYLEDCIAQLKAQNTRASTPTTCGPPPAARPSSYDDSRASSSDQEGDTPMADTAELEPISPTNISPASYPIPHQPHSHSLQHSLSHTQSHTQTQAQRYPTHSPALYPQDRYSPSQTYHPTPSPALLPQDSRHRTNSYSSYTSSARHYSFSATASATTSPCFGTLNSRGYVGYTGSNSGSALTSPALGPIRVDEEEDREATAALLMLGAGRGSGNRERVGAAERDEGRGRGMSVRDLLA